MWGSRIFNEAQTAKDRRTSRSARRRLDRRKERIKILQSLIQDDMEKEFPNFFQMLKETSRTEEDKTISNKIQGIKYNLFSDVNNTDNSYYKTYPTIYHLRKYLIMQQDKVDLRLVYLAIHHIIKYRGNFLYEGDFSENTTEIKEQLNKILDYLNERDIICNCDVEDILNILKNKNISKSNKKEEMVAKFEFDKEEKSTLINVINSFLGYVFDITKIFDIELEKANISFSSEIENEDEIKNILADKSEIYECMNSIYSWYILQDILNGKNYISDAFIEKYEKYEKDLKIIKNIYKKYFPNEYKQMFKMVGTNNYVAYNGKNQGKSCKKCNPEEFFKALKKKIEELPEECKEKSIVLNEIEDNNFLRKINVTDNGAIPNQLHKKELELILENQSKYYPTIAENKDNILKLFSFRIPYYVGPLSKEEGNWSWIVRKSDEKIRPWNFEEIVDEDETAEKFIRRMTNKCTYILNEDVIPKSSLLYSRFCVLNELNNIRVNNHHLAKDTKKKIIEYLFLNNKKVTMSKLKEFLRNEGVHCETITGLSDGTNFNSNMASYIDMKNILGNVDDSNIKQCENLIYWITIFEEKKILKRKIKKEYPDLSDEQINKLCKLRYTGWSRLSEKLLVGLKSNDNQTIMEKLETTPLNFMQIINEKEFGFDKQLEELMPKINKDIKYSDVAEIPTSPANKRAIWQSICVVKEITKIMGHDPENIFIEFARNEEKKVMKDNRVKQLLKKYEEIEKQLNELKDYDPKIYKELKQHQNDKTLNEKMYLYYIQNGKCLYSGQPLNIDNLSLYEVDHIIPQSYIKDDSIDNKALVIKEENQRKKDNMLLSEEIINGRYEWWKNLLESGLISQTKFFRLTKRKMFETDEDREKFVQRQLVETRQITKYVSNLLLNQCKNTNIFAIRAQLTHDIREKYDIYKNRNVNNYHHAHDAYLISVIGNIIDKNWKGTEQFKYGEYVKKYYNDKENIKKNYNILINFINKYIDIETVKKCINYKDCYISRMLIEETGEFYNQTLYSPKEKPVIQLKEGLSTQKYGGYSGENKSYYVIYGYISKKGKQEYKLVGIPIKVAYDIKNKKVKLENYIKETDLKNIKYSEFKILRNHILKNQQYLDANNELMRFCSDSEIRPDKELVLDENMNKIIYFINNNMDNSEEIQINYEDIYDNLIKKIDLEYKSLKGPLEKLINSKEKYMQLDAKEKNIVINKIIDLIESKYVNLKEIGLSSSEGRMNCKTFKTEQLLNMTFIDKSVTGMYERRYKVNGVENISSK